MADNTVLSAGAGGDTIATDDISGVKVQRVKVQFGADGSATDASSAAPFPVYVVSALPAGSAEIGVVGLNAAALAALESITIGTALPAGSNAIGKLAANSGVDIGDVDVTSLPALAAGTNAIGNTNVAGLSTAAQAGTSVTVGTSSSTLVSANSARKLLVICNDHATQIVYLRLGASAAVANQGIRLNAAGGSCVIRGDEYTGEVRAIASGASTVVTLSEV